MKLQVSMPALLQHAGGEIILVRRSYRERRVLGAKVECEFLDDGLIDSRHVLLQNTFEVVLALLTYKLSNNGLVPSSPDFSYIESMGISAHAHQVASSAVSSINRSRSFFAL